MHVGETNLHISYSLDFNLTQIHIRIYVSTVYQHKFREILLLTGKSHFMDLWPWNDIQFTSLVVEYCKTLCSRFSCISQVSSKDKCVLWNSLAVFLVYIHFAWVHGATSIGCIEHINSWVKFIAKIHIHTKF